MQLEPAKDAKPQSQPSIFGIIPIGPALSRLGVRRASDQDVVGKLARAHERGGINFKGKQQRSTGGRPMSGDVSTKLGRGRRGTVVDSVPRTDKPIKSAAKKLATSASASSMPRFPG